MVNVAVGHDGRGGLTMPGRRNTFNEVKGLLGRLDRSIDEARSKRLGDDDRRPSAEGATRGAGEGDANLDAFVGRVDSPNGEAERATPTDARSPVERETAEGTEDDAASSVNRSKYGRAKPLRRPEGPGAGPTGIWAG
ncbi:MAG: hypothetical protein CMJ31_06090 [Phycisphaerae bacterium]|nr:hypothetical protein [Phycisphaerae bacterium]